jgi:hypothetical protein
MVDATESAIIDAIDHFVVDVGDEINFVEATYRRLGFDLSPRGRHSIGSVNHLAVFEGPYLELLGYEADSASVRSDVVGFPKGLNGLVFQPRHSKEIYHQLLERGVQALPPSHLSRPVLTANGERTAAFEVVRLAPGSSGFGRLYFCHHLTPELVWAPDRPPHDNGATHISRVRIISEDIETARHPLSEILAEPYVQNFATTKVAFQVGRCLIEMMSSKEVPAHLKANLPDAAGRTSYMATLTFHVSDLRQTQACLEKNGVAAIATQDRILIAARDASNVGIEFEVGRLND